MRKFIGRLISIISLLILAFLISCSSSSSSSSSGGGGGGEFIPNPPVPIPAGALRWSDPQSWGGARPAAGQVATIPAGKVIALDEDPPELAGVEINGTLIFARRDTKLRTGWIMVSGNMEVGTETDPFIQRAVITLNGKPGSDPKGPEGGIMVTGGTLDLHGETGKTSWTLLAQTATVGTSQLVLQAPPGWRPGDRIVIASTDFDMNQAEEKEVTAVEGSLVTLGSPLFFTHWGATENGVEVRAEVGLLSRNILIQGNEASTQDGKGGHLMAMGKSTMRVSGVEFNRMGRRGEVARYPVHFHLMGDAAGSYVKESSIHHSFNRAVTIHGSHNAVVQGNVAYDIFGHCYFMEDGIETGNLLENNLGLVTRLPPPESQILDSDAYPATFWITNPDNTVRGNVAAGSDGNGIWYDLSLHPTGPSATDSVFPRHVPLREFIDNSAHSNHIDGLFVDTFQDNEAVQYRPRAGGQPGGAPVWANFDGFTAYKNRSRGGWIRGDHTAVHWARLADNEIGFTFASGDLVSDPNMLIDSVIVGETANKGKPYPGENSGVDGRSLPHSSDPGRPIRGFEFYDGLMGAQNVTFVNFRPNSQRKAGALGDFRFDRFPQHPLNYSNTITFVNANKVYFDPLGAEATRPDDEDGHRSMVFVDRGGSVTGTAGNSVVVNNPFMIDATCTFISEWNAFISPLGYGSLVLSYWDDQPAGIAPLRVTRADSGATQTLAGMFQPQRVLFQTNLIDKRSYAIGFGASAPKKIHLEYSYRQGGDWIQLAVPYSNALFKVYRDGDYSIPLASVTSVDEVGAGTGDVYFYDTVSQMLHVKLMVRSDIPGRDFAMLDIVP